MGAATQGMGGLSQCHHGPSAPGPGGARGSFKPWCRWLPLCSPKPAGLGLFRPYSGLTWGQVTFFPRLPLLAVSGRQGHSLHFPVALPPSHPRGKCCNPLCPQNPCGGIGIAYVFHQPFHPPKLPRESLSDSLLSISPSVPYSPSGVCWALHSLSRCFTLPSFSEGSVIPPARFHLPTTRRAGRP